MRNLLIALLLTGFAGTARLRADDDKMMLTPAKLVGTYRITVGQEFGGKKKPSDKITDTFVKFTKDRITVIDSDDKEVYIQTYKLDADAKPCKLMLKAVKPKVAEEVEGLIKMDGDTVTLIYALPGAEAPTEFKTKDKQLMFTMKKVEGSK